VDTIAIINKLMMTTEDPTVGQYVGQFWILAEEVVEAMANYYGYHPCISFSFGKDTRVLLGVLPTFQGLLEGSRDWLIGLDVSNITASLNEDQSPIVLGEMSALFGAFPLQHVDISGTAVKHNIELLLPLLKPGLKTLIASNIGFATNAMILLVNHLMTPNEQGIPPARSLVSLNLKDSRGGLGGASQLAEMFPLCENLESLNVFKW
jgi:hypothetical protein